MEYATITTLVLIIILILIIKKIAALLPTLRLILVDIWG